MAKHILHYAEWQSPTGVFYTNDTSDLSGISGYWWIPSYLLGMTPSQYVEWLIKTYKPDNITFDGKTFLYSWNKENYSRCHAFTLFINKEARKKNFIV